MAGGKKKRRATSGADTVVVVKRESNASSRVPRDPPRRAAPASSLLSSPYAAPQATLHMLPNAKIVPEPSGILCLPGAPDSPPRVDPDCRIILPKSILLTCVVFEKSRYATSSAYTAK
ncbi:hypothetical protein FRC12_025202 [Ceratobasidium sp. 428]|nr:hypothetical protein FRC12_025202 [Ceratobasidium sp. 428]